MLGLKLFESYAKFPRFVRGFDPHTPHQEFRPKAPECFELNPPSQLVRKELKTQSSKSSIH